MKQFWIMIFAVFFIAACSAAPELLARPGGNPAGIDLSGTWVLRGPDAVPRPQEQTIVLPRATSRVSEQTRQQQPRRKSRSKDSAVHVFLETGKTLQISQTAFGLFISYDRAVVEEFTFGENRTVSVGPIEAQRVSGWVGESLLIETMDEKGFVLSESWQLQDGGKVLRRDVQISRSDEQTMSLQQFFDRTD
jgi:hypothetical protein